MAFATIRYTSNQSREGNQRRAGARWSARLKITRSIARMTRAGNLPLAGVDLLHHLGQVVGRRRLHGRKLLKGLQVTQRNSLADRQDVPVVLEGGHRPGECTTNRHRRLLVSPRLPARRGHA